jgi:hypothetical protein
MNELGSQLQDYLSVRRALGHKLTETGRLLGQFGGTIPPETRPWRGVPGRAPHYRGFRIMAEVGAVYDATPVPRTPADILAATDGERAGVTPGPGAEHKWLTASVVEDAASVVGQIFEEADRRDAEHHRTWVALVDGNNHQIERIAVEAKARDVTVSVVIDLVHVLEYLWKAAWCFFAEGDSAAEAWVRRHALTVLAGGATRVAGTIRRQATNAHLEAISSGHSWAASWPARWDYRASGWSRHRCAWPSITPCFWPSAGYRSSPTDQHWPPSRGVLPQAAVAIEGGIGHDTHLGLKRARRTSNPPRIQLRL